MSNKVYIAILSRIEGMERKSFSSTLNKLMEYYDGHYSIENDKALETGVSFTRGDKEGNKFGTNHILSKWFENLRDTGNWCSWMNGWTDVTIMLLYSGSEVIDIA